MAILQDIEVRIARNTSGKVDADDAGDALPEYQKPDTSDNQSQTSVERYVEAVIGQAFQIEVHIRPSFNFFAANGITVTLVIDDETIFFEEVMSKEYIEKLKAAGEPIILSSVPRLDGTRHYAMGFIFGSLNLDERLDVDKDIVDRQAERQGRILVGVERHVAEKLRKPVSINVQEFYKSTASLAFAKDVYKDRHIRQAVMPGLETETEELEPITHKRRPYRHRKCRKLQFVFRYRDHMGLELLGCKPKDITGTTTVTEPISIEDDPNDPDIESNNAEKRDEGKCEEITQLRAENRRLQAFEREAAELKHTVEGLKQENASMKAIKDQIAALTGTFGNTSSTPVPSTTTGIKSEVKKEYIKKEQSEGRPSPSSNGKDRPAKRPRTFVELD